MGNKYIKISLWLYIMQIINLTLCKTRHCVINLDNLHVGESKQLNLGTQLVLMPPKIKKMEK